VQTENGELSTYILNETTQRAEADSAQVTAINAIAVGQGDNAAAIATEAAVRLTADEALTSLITTAESSLNGNIAQVQTNLNTEIGIVDGELANIGALYTAKVNVNGLIGGFGIYNDGSTVQAGFDVDNFWIGRTGPDKVKPFIINGDTVYMNNVMIAQGSIDNAKIGNIIQSANYVAGSAGWKIDKTGQMEMNNATFRGSITSGGVELGKDVGPGAGHHGLSLSADNFNDIFIKRDDGVRFFRVNSGGTNSLTFDSASGVLAVKGNLTGSTGTFSGTLSANAINAVNTINIAGQAVSISGANSFYAGYDVSPMGNRCVIEFYLPVASRVLLGGSMLGTGEQALAIGTLYVDSTPLQQSATGNPVNTIDGIAANVYATPQTFLDSVYLAAGWHTAYIAVTQSSATFSWIYPYLTFKATLFILATMR